MAEIEKELRHYLEGDVDPRTALEWSRETSAVMVDLKFCDLLGTWQHVSLPVAGFDESAFEEGLGFDGSSIRGWQGISESDMLLMPDASSAILDPFTEAPTLSLAVRDLRSDHARAVRQGSRGGWRSAPRTTFAPPASPTRSTSARSASSSSSTTCRTRAGRTRRATRSTPPRATGTRATPGSATRCARSTATSRSRRTTRCTICGHEMVLTLERLGVPCEFHHHEVATAGQCEIDLRFQSLTRMADQIMLYKYVVRNTALARREVGHVHAEADLRRQRLGHAHAPVALEGRHAALRRQVGPGRAVAARAVVRRPDCSRTRRRCSPSARRRRTRTAGSCRATRRR